MTTIKFDVPGKKRKELAQTIATWLGEEVMYMGAPSFAYHLGNQIIDRNGNVSLVRLDAEAVERLLEHLHDEGFDFISTFSDEEEQEAAAEESTEDLSLTVTMPRDFFTDSQLDNLEKLIAAKAPLLKKALGVTELSVSITDETVSFPWFKDDVDAEHCAAYTSLITALCRMAKEAKRVNAKEKETTNAKYEFRCFLLRLGFIGDEFKANRKILLEKLSGSSAFKSGKAKETAVCGE